jgi:hypothetical protein
MVQYFYYSRNAPPAPAARSRSRIARARESVDHMPSVHSPAHYRALSSVAANVAASAAFAANQETHWRRSTDALRDTASPDRHRVDDEDDEVDEDALAALADSIHSTRSRHGVSWSKERYGSATRVPRTLSPVQSLEPFPRGRAAERADELEGEGDQAQAEEESRRRRNSRAGRMSASIVFMGAWTLFGAGALLNGGRGLRESGIRVGHVFADVARPSSVDAAMLPLAGVLLPSVDRDLLTSVELPDDSVIFRVGATAAEPPSLERIIGRIFAWSCTTLYLTSRLPQIWKNVRFILFWSAHHRQLDMSVQYVRKSVEVRRYLAGPVAVLTLCAGPLDIPLHLRIFGQFLLCHFHSHRAQYVSSAVRGSSIYLREHTVRNNCLHKVTVLTCSQILAWKRRHANVRHHDRHSIATIQAQTRTESNRPRIHRRYRGAGGAHERKHTRSR